MANLLGGGNDEIDFDKAASAFPDIDLDGDIFDIPTSGSGGAASFDINSFEPTPIGRDVAVTGDEDGVIEKFESEFPELDVRIHSRVRGLCSQLPTHTGYSCYPACYSAAATVFVPIPANFCAPATELHRLDALPQAAY
jgi:hypothetical protein